MLGTPPVCRTRALEVVCSDWGLLHVLTEHKLTTPVIGRVLTARPSDPRLLRMLNCKGHSGKIRTLIHLDGRRCRLRFQPPTEAQALQYRSCWIDKPAVISWLMARGICRAEVDNTGQGIELATVPGWSYSLHVPEVLVAVMRSCPGAGEDFAAGPACPSARCAQSPVAWSIAGFPAVLWRHQNALYYNWTRPPHELDSLPVDRIVRRESACLCRRMSTKPDGF